MSGDADLERPHSALDCQTPADYARTLTTAIGVNINRAPVVAG